MKKHKTSAGAGGTRVGGETAPDFSEFAPAVPKTDDALNEELDAAVSNFRKRARRDRDARRIVNNSLLNDFRRGRRR